MERINYFKTFAFLAFIGSAFLSTIFHYPVFTFSWFIVMVLFATALSREKSELTILAFTVIAFVPLGLIYVLKNDLSQTIVNPPNSVMSSFAVFLSVWVVIELIAACLWIECCRDTL